MPDHPGWSLVKIPLLIKQPLSVVPKMWPRPLLTHGVWGLFHIEGNGLYLAPQKLQLSQPSSWTFPALLYFHLGEIHMNPAYIHSAFCLNFRVFTCFNQLRPILCTSTGPYGAGLLLCRRHGAVGGWRLLRGSAAGGWGRGVHGRRDSDTGGSVWRNLTGNNDPYVYIYIYINPYEHLLWKFG